MLAVCLSVMFQPLATHAQPLTFGSADDPFEEIPPQWWLRKSHVDIMGGFSLIGARWRSAVNLSATLVSRDLAGRFMGTFHAGVDGFRDEDTNERYDALRLVDFVKYSPRRVAGFHLRAGPTDRMRLGTGHLVNFYSTKTAWDDRTIGGEFAWHSRLITIQAFTGDLLLDAVAGARAAIRPLGLARNRRLRSFELGFGAVQDTGQPYEGQAHLTGFNADARFLAANIGEILVSPFASVALIENFGRGFGIGTQIGSQNLIDLARIDLKLAFHHSEKQFTPGYFGPFYQVSNLSAAILKSEDLTDDDPPGATSGVRLPNIDSGNDFVTEFRILFFEDFEFWYYFRRHFGNQPLSQYHLRMFFSTRRLRVSLSQDRAGLRGFFSLFNDLGDQTALSFRTDYEVTNLLWVFVTARYTYERQGPEEDQQLFLVERRFEPMTGFRFTF